MVNFQGQTVSLVDGNMGTIPIIHEYPHLYPIKSPVISLNILICIPENIS